MSEESIKPPDASDNSLAPKLTFINKEKIAVKFEYENTCCDILYSFHRREEFSKVYETDSVQSGVYLTDFLKVNN